MNKIIVWIKKLLNYSTSPLTYIVEDKGLYQARLPKGEPISDLRHATIGGACMEAKRKGYAVGINSLVPRIISPEMSDRDLSLLFNRDWVYLG
jgi:hypothetical protein